MAEISSRYRWSMTYRVVFMLAFLAFLGDTFIQMALKNTAMTILSLIFSIAFFIVTVMMYKVPFATISKQRFSFFFNLIIRQTIDLADINLVSEYRKWLRINLITGKEVMVFLPMMNPADKNSLIEALQDVGRTNMDRKKAGCEPSLGLLAPRSGTGFAYPELGSHRLSMEPLVLERIKHYRRGILKQKIAIATVAVIGLILSLASVIYAFYLVASSDDVELSQAFMPVAMPLGILMMCMAISYLAIRGIKFESHFVACRLDSEQHERFVDFRNGLQGSSIAVGTKPPPLRVVDIKGVSTLSITLKDRNPTVVVTLDALNAGLSQAETEAIMAHELSHILIGDDVHLPARSRFDAFMWSALVSISAFSAASITWSAMAESSFAWYSAGCSGLVMLLFCLLVPKFLFRRRSHDDLLADSLAAKITNNPAALKNAISEFARLYLLGTVLTSIFARTDSRHPSGFWRNELIINKDESRAMVSVRIRNLEAIERGHWPVSEQ